MEKIKWTRTPEAQTIVQDFDLEVVNSLILPVIDEDNTDEQPIRAIGFKDGALVYFDGANFIRVGIIDPEIITVDGATGTVEIDFNLSDRLEKYGTNPTIKVYETDGDIKSFFKDFGEAFNTTTKILTLDGVFGNKTIVIKR